MFGKTMIVHVTKVSVNQYALKMINSFFVKMANQIAMYHVPAQFCFKWFYLF